jgi:hypothetical protein
VRYKRPCKRTDACKSADWVCSTVKKSSGVSSPFGFGSCWPNSFSKSAWRLAGMGLVPPSDEVDWAAREAFPLEG